MHILVDVTHPMHAHFFRHAIERWRAIGHSVLVTSRDKDITLQLLDEFGFEHKPIGRARHGVIGLATELIMRAWGLSRVIQQFHPDVAVAEAGTFIAYGCLPHRIPLVLFSDTEHAKIANTITYPLAKVVITPRAYQRNVGAKQIRYNGYQQLAYTHPSIFTPDSSVLENEGLALGEPFIIIRVVKWGASHDVADHGIQDLREVVHTLSRYGRIILSSEKQLPSDLQILTLRGPHRNMLHLQAFARLFFGESATMASECAMLGTPAIFLSTSRRGYIDEQASLYKMTFSFNDPKTGQAQALEKACQLLEDPNTPTMWQTKRRAMLSELINVTDFITAIVPRYARIKST